MLLRNSKDSITHGSATFEELNRHVEQIIYKLEEDQIIEDIMEEVVVAINELKSVEEIKKYLKRKIDSLVKRTIVLSEFYNLEKVEKPRKENYIYPST
ncbi:hypothetical protein JSQ73_005925 [Wolbachia endosymbiont of Anopheles demeilloni]|uniref:hypothetical protein n=1 Tax=Wolbachia endosymbiont of Anopheles demeilloni TaxID=2748871 RepID=UPI001BDA1A3D|nr:hypothetical protein [Wolbachia endosymbiont of Anopheles demeilloni]UIP92671.1 hypothetical protein JSQ73_005925 [Wolbachia endosymbiont of Anopheles demeilloni]